MHLPLFGFRLHSHHELRLSNRCFSRSPQPPQWVGAHSPRLFSSLAHDTRTLHFLPEEGPPSNSQSLRALA